MPTTINPATRPTASTPRRPRDWLGSSFTWAPRWPTLQSALAGHLEVTKGWWGTDDTPVRFPGFALIGRRHSGRAGTPTGGARRRRGGDHHGVGRRRAGRRQRARRDARPRDAEAGPGDDGAVCRRRVPPLRAPAGRRRRRLVPAISDLPPPARPGGIARRAPGGGRLRHGALRPRGPR